jgi:hypothetical protein
MAYLLGCYILCSESQGGSTDGRIQGGSITSQRSRMVYWVKSKSKFEAVQHGKCIDKKSKSSTDKSLTGGHVATN